MPSCASRSGGRPSLKDVQTLEPTGDETPFGPTGDETPFDHVQSCVRVGPSGVGGDLGHCQEEGEGAVEAPAGVSHQSRVLERAKAWPRERSEDCARQSQPGSERLDLLEGRPEPGGDWAGPGDEAGAAAWWGAVWSAPLSSPPGGRPGRCSS